MRKRNPNLIAIRVHLDREIYARAKEIAYRLDLPVKGWMAECVARGILGWKDPVSRKRENIDPDAVGLECMVCGGKAKDCRYPFIHNPMEWRKP